MKTRRITKTYGGMVALDFPETIFMPDQTYAVLGPNGSGKSTLAKLLAGTLSPDDAQMPVWDCLPSIGYMPQKSYVFHMTVRQNILLNGGKTPEDEQRAQWLMQELDLLHLQNRKARVLSGGETSRVALARLLMQDYDLLILDEPTAALDVQATLAAEMLLKEYQKRTHCSILLITHMLKQAARIADEAIFLSGGQIAERGKTQQILADPQSEDTRQFLDFYNL